MKRILDDLNDKKSVKIALLITLLAILIRLPFLGSFPLFVDEFITMQLSDRIISDIVPNFMVVKEIHPPFYFFLVRIWMLFWFASSGILGGIMTYEFFLRISSVIAGAGTVYMTFLVGRKIFNNKIALLSSLFVALSNFHLHYARELRMYPLLLLFGMISFYYFLLMIEKPRFPTAVGFALSTGAALFTHYFGFYFLAIEFLFLGYLALSLYVFKSGKTKSKKKTKTIFEQEEDEGFPKICANLAKEPESFIKSVKLLALSALVSILPMIAWFTFFIRQAGQNSFQLRMSPSIAMLFDLVIKMAYGNVIYRPPAILGMNFRWITILVPILLIGWVFVYSRNRAKVFAGLWLFLPAVVSFIFSTYTRFHLFEYKYFYLSIPALWLFISKFLTGVKSRVAVYSVITLFIAANLFMTFGYYTNPYLQTQDWKSTAEFVRQNADKDDSIVIIPLMMSKVFEHYFGNDPRIKTVEKMDEKSSSEIIAKKGAWVVFMPMYPQVMSSGIPTYLAQNYSGGQVGGFIKNNPYDIILVHYYRLTKHK